jgi:hypothetical protein
MPIEIELGTLIRRMNPYTNGTRNSMRFYPVPHGGTTSVVAADARDAAEATALAAAAATAASRAAAAHLEAANARVRAADARVARAAAAPAAIATADVRIREAVAAVDNANAAASSADVLANSADDAVALAHIDVEVENYNHYEGQWSFKGQAYNIRRALLIPYRYPLKDKNGNENGLYATENLLVGFAGVNGP